MLASRGAYAFSLDDWKIQEQALPVEGFFGNPVKQNKEDLNMYLETLGVEYV